MDVSFVEKPVSSKVEEDERWDISWKSEAPAFVIGKSPL